ncbi:DUF5403 family protein [Saccharothrix lopnurensis]|uniref:DUF5403 family protein n=1 Tax=Saccharothrix lopnurensis TaxID=1670621 RepID=A0ABW1P714_9PSEU
MAFVYHDAAEKIAHLDGVTAAVVEAAGPTLRRARALLAEHTTDDDGEHHEVVLRLGQKTDAFVDLIGPAPVALEIGHVTPKGKMVEGRHILKRALGE